MVDVTTLLIGFIFVLIIIIVIVYLVFFNRTVLPMSVITETGFTLSNNKRFITLESISVPSFTQSPTLTLQAIPTGEFITGAQEWVFVTTDGNTVELLGTQSGNTVSGTEIFILNTFNGAYVTYTTENNTTIIDGILVANAIETSNAQKFILEYNNPTIVNLRSTLLPIDGQNQYIIPGPMINTGVSSNTAMIVTIGVPQNDNDKNWTVSQLGK